MTAVGIGVGKTDRALIIIVCPAQVVDNTG
jgi:hypothetical protein